MIFPKQRNGGKVEWPSLNTNEIVEEQNSCGKYKQSTKFSLKVLQDWNVIIVFIEKYRLQELDKAL